MREMIRARRAMLAGVLEVSVKCGRLPPNAGDLTGLVFSTRRRPHSQRPNEPMIPYLPSYDVLGAGLLASMPRSFLGWCCNIRFSFYLGCAQLGCRPIVVSYFRSKIKSPRVVFPCAVKSVFEGVQRCPGCHYTVGERIPSINHSEYVKLFCLRFGRTCFLAIFRQLPLVLES